MEIKNGKGDKQRVRWSKKFEEKYNKIFKKREGINDTTRKTNKTV